jgi:hypothetical protein
MRCYNCDRFGHKSKNYRKSRIQSMRNNSNKSGRKSNEGWKKIRNDKSQRTKLEKKDPTNKISHEKVWRRKYEIENKRDDMAPKNKEVSLTQNSDESSIAYQPEEMSNENLGSFPMLFS